MGKSRRTQALWEEQEKLERDVGIIDIPRKEKKGHGNSNSRVGKEAITARSHRFWSLPTHQPSQLLTAELAQKDISPGHSQVFQPAVCKGRDVQGQQKPPGNEMQMVTFRF